MVSRGLRAPLGALMVGLALAVGGCSDPATITLSEPVAQITAGGTHTCALTLDGVGYCWGRGYTGELGDGFLSVRHHAVRVAVEEPLESITAGYFHTCGLGESGTAYCWGWNRYGQVGVEGEPDVSPDPMPVAVERSFVQLSAGWYHTCGVTDSGEALCWGRNVNGALGDGSTVDRWAPVPVSGGLTFSSVTAGGRHTCGTTAAAEVVCWGDNGEGQLGDGTVERRLAPVPVSGGHVFRDVDAGRGHTCGVTTAERVLCWGSNARGELGVGETNVPGVAGRKTPTAVNRAQAYRTVSAGDDYSCAVDAAAVAYCWGRGSSGELGNTLLSDRNMPTVVRNVSFRSIAASAGTHTCGIDTSRAATCWGTGQLGQLGVPGTDYTSVPMRAGIRDE